LLLTERSHNLADHAGQISFPGGRVDKGETVQAAALRELNEELGISSSDVSLVGQLTSIFVFASDYCIRPFVAILQATVPLRPNDAEVASVLEIPLHELQAEPHQIGRQLIRRGALVFSAPHIQWHGHLIWGATATILGEFAAILREQL
jgi:8-oxo-dGTP pyrophosphatase MutT (NUDIX family)